MHTVWMRSPFSNEKERALPFTIYSNYGIIYTRYVPCLFPASVSYPSLLSPSSLNGLFPSIFAFTFANCATC
jgi:hypothetical protein